MFIADPKITDNVDVTKTIGIPQAMSVRITISTLKIALELRQNVIV